MERVLRREGHAKINVWLHVLGRRPDGYHDIDTLIVPVSLADEMTFRPAPELRLSIRGDQTDLVPLDESNLVIRAAAALRSACGVDVGADIELEKRIPVAAGLGGGSADAAATLHALSELWGCDLGNELLEIAAGIGSDVPALVAGQPVVVHGRGEVVWHEPVPLTWWVLYTQAFPVSTADAYGWWDEDGGQVSHRSIPHGLDGPSEMAASLRNDLEDPVARRHPEVRRAKEHLLELGPLGAVMCGSGPTVAGLAPTEDEAQRISERLPGSIVVSAPP
jgi:4-diphosphocytidyl-2-C-methyl-D-erythritol kinase